MPIVLSYLTVTPTWSSKKLTIDGAVAVRESVALKIVGCGTDTSVVFKMSSEDGRVDYAKFPNAAGDAWAVVGADLTGALSLNTDLLVAAFAALGPCDTINFVCTIASATSSNLFAVGQKAVRNWMEDADDPVAYSTPLADAIEEHAHDGITSVKLSHTGLNDIGTNTHAQIDAALQSHTDGIADNTQSIVTYSSSIATHGSNIANNTAAINILNRVVGAGDPKASALKPNDFTLVAAVPDGSPTMKVLKAKINEILTILKG